MSTCRTRAALRLKHIGAIDMWKTHELVVIAVIAVLFTGVMSYGFGAAYTTAVYSKGMQPMRDIVAQCEKSLPRDQHCELRYTAVVISK